MRALQRLGRDNPRCVICGESRVECLERHHVAGRNHAPQEVILCANCHRCNSDPSADQSVPATDNGEARFLEGLSELLNERARYVRREVM